MIPMQNSRIHIKPMRKVFCLENQHVTVRVSRNGETMEKKSWGPRVAGGLQLKRGRAVREDVSCFFFYEWWSPNHVPGDPPGPSLPS